MRRYLKEFLSDPRVIDTPKWLWWPILNLVILNVRPQKSGHAYAQIWDKTHNDSPLRIISQEQTAALAERMAGDGVVVDYAMRYGNPSTPSVLEKMQKQGCTKILLVPLYPQYSATTTATANDKAFDALKEMRWQPAVRTAPAYFEDPKYIETLGNSIRDGVAALDFTGPRDHQLSRHAGDLSQEGRSVPLPVLQDDTPRARVSGWSKEKIMVTFQSRFGPTQWLEPYTDKTLEALPGKGIKKVAILAPAFSADCIETLEEIAMGGKDTFLEAGGEKFAYIPCLNASPGGMDMIEAMVRRELSGWL